MRLATGRVVLCRGCCCGVATGRSHGAEHRLRRLLHLQDFGFKVSTSECLGPCSLGDMLVFIPSKIITDTPIAHQPKGRKGPIWFSGMHLDSLNELFIDWLLSDLPLNHKKFGLLQMQEYKPKKNNREAINEHLSCVV